MIIGDAIEWFQTTLSTKVFTDMTGDALVRGLVPAPVFLESGALRGTGQTEEDINRGFIDFSM